MTTIRKFYRLIVFGLLLLLGVLLTTFFLHKAVPPRGFTSKLITTWLYLAAKTFAVKIKTFGTPLPEKVLFVANHISWLDILVIGGIVPVHFLSKHEVKTIPLLGWLATRAGTLYIKRGKKDSASDATIEITEALNKQHNSLVFAEGTTTDGHIKKFHGRMLQSAIDAHATIQPIAIFYPRKNLENNKTELNPAALFIGNTTAGESMNLILQEAKINVEVHFLKPIEAKGKSRDELAIHAYEEVVDAISAIKRATH